MRPLSSAEIRGTWGTVLLPIGADDSIDFVALADEVDTLIEAGLDGLYTNGTAGEFHTQTEEEFDKVSALVAERCSRRGVSFQIGVCHTSAQIARDRLRRIKALEPAAIQVIPPDWVPLSASETEVFMVAMAELAHPIGLVLYTPAHAKRPLDLAAIARLRAAVPALVGAKMPDGNASWYSAARRQLPEFSIFVPGHHLATGMTRGASGSYSNVACLSPRGARKWEHLIQSDPVAALAFEARLLSFLQTHVAPLAAQGHCPVALDKALCAAGGWCAVGPRVRWPYQSVSSEAVRQLASAAHDDLPELWP